MDPKHPVREAFDRAADAAAARRKQQEVALTALQRAEYEKMRNLQITKLRLHDELYRRNYHHLIDQQKERIMRETLDPALRMHAAEGMREIRAYRLAKDTVNRRHAIERETMERDHQTLSDKFLHQAEQAREKPKPEPTKPTELSKLFSRMAAAREPDRDRGRERD